MESITTAKNPLQKAKKNKKNEKKGRFTIIFKKLRMLSRDSSVCVRGRGGVN